jgi:hypothetical protein
MFAMRSRQEYELVRLLISTGHGNVAIARRTGIPPSTVNNWRTRPCPRQERARLATTEWRPTDADAYCYLLGLYLGDGCICRSRGSSFLRLSLDVRYPAIIEEASAAMSRVLPGITVRSYVVRGSGCGVLQASHPVWPYAFPQHGTGKKHERSIELVGWQLELTRRHPRELIRGLIQSDGCRAINRFSVDLPVGGRRQYEYVRYFFSNLSADIRGIFVGHCALLGIRCTQSNHRNISVSHRDSVALLESFVGPKR